MKIIEDSQSWLFQQTPELISFGIGVVATYFFVSTVFKNRVKRLQDDVEYLRLELRESDIRCNERVKGIESRYKSELETIKYMNESSERRILGMLKVIGDIKADLLKK